MLREDQVFMTNIMERVMKRLVAVAFSLAVLFEAGEGHAQTSVTLYGVIDTGVGSVKTSAGGRWGFIDSTLQGTRWGMKGTEDLGGGLSAIFDLESGFDIGTGQSGQG